MFFRIFFFLLFSFLIKITAAQQTALDTTSTQQTSPKAKEIDSLSLLHSPRKATLYSAILPGLGQAYNKKYWKVPVIYGAFALTGYFIHYNNVRYHKYNDELIARDKNDSASLNPNLINLDNDAIKSASDDFRRYRDLDIILMGLIYVLNIVDAHVDAHLFYFNVDDNLSLQLNPQLQKISDKNYSANLRLKFNF